MESHVNNNNNNNISSSNITSFLPLNAQQIFVQQIIAAAANLASQQPLNKNDTSGDDEKTKELTKNTDEKTENKWTPGDKNNDKE